MSNKLNPQIQTLEIGVKSLKEVTIYPLSMADQFHLSDIISKAVSKYSKPDEPQKDADEPSQDEQQDNTPKTEVEVFRAIMTLVEENLITILDLVTDDEVQISLNDLTNPQFADLCTIIYEENFDNAAGKLLSLFNKTKTLLKSKRLQQKSSLKPAINTNTSSDSHSEMEE